jgi:hypothetical protein
MRLLFTIFIIFSSPFLFAQLQSLKGGKPRQLTKKEEKMDRENQHCVHKNRFSTTQRLSKFPFRIAREVRIISYEPFWSPRAYAPATGIKVDISKLKESITLNKKQTDSLTDILYNTGYKGVFYTFSKGCFNPRNSILFIDTSGLIFAYIEICFECHAYSLSSKDVNAGEFCIEKYDLLQFFFRRVGIKYGTEITD